MYANAVPSSPLIHDGDVVPTDLPLDIVSILFFQVVVVPA